MLTSRPVITCGFMISDPLSSCCSSPPPPYRGELAKEDAKDALVDAAEEAREMQIINQLVAGMPVRSASLKNVAELIIGGQGRGMYGGGELLRRGGGANLGGVHGGTDGPRR